MAGRFGEALVAGGGVEEAGEGLGQPLAVVGVGDEAAPRRRDALEAADRLDGHTREDVDVETVREAAAAADCGTGGGGAASLRLLGLGALHGSVEINLLIDHRYIPLDVRSVDHSRITLKSHTIFTSRIKSE